MPSLKEVRIRIESVKSTQQITSAMKMVAASKLRKAQNAILTMRPYAAKLTEIMQNISANLDESSESPFTQQRDLQRILIIGIASNRGLCGPFNVNVAKAIVKNITEKYPAQYKAGNVEIITIGKKLSDFLNARNYKIAKQYDDLLENLSFAAIQPIARQFMDDFAAQKFDHIEIIYNQFKNAAVQILQTETLLPVIRQEEKNQEPSGPKIDFIFEPSEKEIITELIPKSLKIQFYKALLDSTASEHGARMTAMHKATDNAQDLLKELKLSYNKARQAAITNEILEIVGGAEALKG
jgi:F-type H+-transporting ATPase subunit gamma